jgi:hypothetical protein
MIPYILENSKLCSKQAFILFLLKSKTQFFFLFNLRFGQNKKFNTFMANFTILNYQPVAQC